MLKQKIAQFFSQKVAQKGSHISCSLKNYIVQNCPKLFRFWDTFVVDEVTLVGLPKKPNLVTLALSTKSTFLLCS